MSFKDLCKFNDTMLAKQVWWLVHDTNSLFYRIFKAKYFPSSIVIEAKATSRSYDWKNTLWARIAIDMGAKWRIGDGRDIQIYEDDWLPGNYGGRVLVLPISHLRRTTTVSNLIDTDSNGWNSQLLDTPFLPFSR